jgi:hypothetical protein
MLIIMPKYYRVTYVANTIFQGLDYGTIQKYALRNQSRPPIAPETTEVTTNMLVEINK